MRILYRRTSKLLSSKIVFASRDLQQQMTRRHYLHKTNPFHLIAAREAHVSNTQMSSISQEPPTPHTPDNGDDDNPFQREDSNLRIDIILVSFWALLVTMAVVMFVIQKSRELRDPTIVSMFDCRGRQRRRAQQEAQRERQLELQQRARRQFRQATRMKLSSEEIVRRAQKLRDAYLHIFQQTQVQLVSRQEATVVVFSQIRLTLTHSLYYYYRPSKRKI